MTKLEQNKFEKEFPLFKSFSQLRTVKGSIKEQARLHNENFDEESMIEN